MAPSLESRAIALFCALVGALGAVAQLGERLVRNEEVRGSIPLGSTSLRRFAAPAGKPAFVHQRFRGEGVAKRRRLPVEARRAKTGWGLLQNTSICHSRVNLVRPPSCMEGLSSADLAMPRRLLHAR